MVNSEKNEKGKQIIKYLFPAIIGIIIAGIIMWLSMPGMMLIVHESRYNSVEETASRLQTAIKANGWTSPPIRDMNKTMADQGVLMDKNVKIVELCNAQYAKDVLMTNPEISTLMPCAWGIYKEKDGKVYIAGMNMKLMGKIFGGNIAQVMGNAVAKDEERILKAVIAE